MRARGHAEACGDPARIGAVAFGLQHLGARFAMRRHDVIEPLEAARQAVAGRDTSLEAQLTAAKVPASAPIQAKMQAADRAMMTWMHQYQAPDSTAPAPQRLAYLQDQQKQLSGIEQQLRAVLDSAQATLGRATAPKATAPAAATSATPAATQPK